MGATVRLTAAQALVRWLAALRVEGAAFAGSRGPVRSRTGMRPAANRREPADTRGSPPRRDHDEAGGERLFGGVWAIFGHGNVAGIGEALYAHRDELPTYRAHNEQAMAHAAIAYAKAHMRRRMMACTTSIGPGATNMVTAAALAHVNRLPVLLLPGDIFVSRAPDPVLQQIEDFHDGGVSANDCFKPVSRYFDRIVHPAQLLTALPRALEVLTDAALCGPVTLAMPQDVQTMAHDWPEAFFAPPVVRFHAPAPVDEELADAVATLRAARKPLIVAGGGTLYALATDALRRFAETHGVPVAETQGGKGSLAWDHPLQAGAIGVTGSPAANALARDADAVLAVGTRLQDFTTGSHSLFPQAKLVSLNVNGFDALKWRGTALRADARRGLEALADALVGWRADAAWTERARGDAKRWQADLSRITQGEDGRLPNDGEVLGAVQRSSKDSPAHDIVVCAAGTLPGELHKLWRTSTPGGYHVEYGYSCMGYEIAGGLGVKMAKPDREVVVMVGDGSYLMMNSEIATSLMLGRKLTIVVLDNRGFGCINRLQQACGGAPFNNLLADCEQGPDGPPAIDFAAHARALGADAVHVRSLAELGPALAKARAATRTSVVCIDTDPHRTVEAGGWWWEVAVPEVSSREEVRDARAKYDRERQKQEP